jgi:hypothetical protein
VKRSYPTINKQGNVGEKKLTEFLVPQRPSAFADAGADRAEPHGRRRTD